MKTGELGFAVSQYGIRKMALVSHGGFVMDGPVPKFKTLEAYGGEIKILDQHKIFHRAYRRVQRKLARPRVEL